MDISQRLSKIDPLPVLWTYPVVTVVWNTVRELTLLILLPHLYSSLALHWGDITILNTRYGQILIQYYYNNTNSKTMFMVLSS